jgi:hypothetical protein
MWVATSSAISYPMQGRSAVLKGLVCPAAADGHFKAAEAEGTPADLSVPAATRVVYSTCSIHVEEDERVVLAALRSGIAKERGWRLAPRAEVLPAWRRRGRVEEFGGDQGMSPSRHLA